MTQQYGYILNKTQKAVLRDTERQTKKVVLFVNDNISGNLILNRLIPEIITMGLKPVIYVLAPVSPAGANIETLMDFTFYDTTIGKSVLYPFLDSRSALCEKNGKPLKNRAYSLKQIEKLYGIDIHHTSDINKPENFKPLCDDPQVLGAISIRNLQIFKQAMIDGFTKNKFLWNLHSGLLPEYRGVHPQLWAMVNGEKECGLTLHQIDKSIDTGAIIEMARQKLTPGASYLALFFEKNLLAAPLVTKALGRYKKERYVDIKVNDNKTARYFSFPAEKDCRLIEEKGIIIANPLEMLDIYLKSYSLPGSTHEHQLKHALIQAIAEWEQGKKKKPENRTYMPLLKQA